MRHAILFAIVLCVGLMSLARAATPPYIWIEAESCVDYNWDGPADFPGVVSGDRILRLWSDTDPGPKGYYARFPFQTDRAGKYYVWVGVSVNSVSPFYWRIDDGAWHSSEQITDGDVGNTYGVSDCMAWVRLDAATLKLGNHSLIIKVTDRRIIYILPEKYLLYMDAVLITARDVRPDRLVTPAELPRLKPMAKLKSEKIVPVRRAMKPGPPMLLGSEAGQGRINRMLASLGFDYLQTDDDHLTVNELAPGKWDWSVGDAGLAAAQAAGVAWQYFPHFYWAPDWLTKTDRFVPSVGLNTGRKLRAMSIWDPNLPEWYEHCYAALAAHYGTGSNKLASIYLGVYGDFGEATFPLGLHPFELRRFGEKGAACPDYWCGDEYSRASFRDWARRKYTTLSSLGAAWGVSPGSWDEVSYPPETVFPYQAIKWPEQMTVPERRHWLDFITWYHDSMTAHAAMVARTARRHFPKARLVMPVGNGEEQVVTGADLSALVKICRESGVEIRSTHGGVYPVPTNLSSLLRRLASASQLYGVPFWSEPPGGMGTDQMVGRIFESLSCRASGFYDFFADPVGNAKVFCKYKQFMTREETVCDVAMLFPSTDHMLRSMVGYPTGLLKIGPMLRSTMDFDIIDERMISDDALKSIRVLVSTDGTFFTSETLARIEAWMRDGGVLVRGAVPMMTVEGDTTVWNRISGMSGNSSAARKNEPTAEDWSSGMIRGGTVSGSAEVVNAAFLGYTAAAIAGRNIAGCDDVSFAAKVLATAGGQPAIWARRVGRGWSIICAGAPQDALTFRSVVRDAVYHLSALDPTKKDAQELAPTAAWGNLYTLLLMSGEVIAYNHGDTPVRTAIAGCEVTVAPHSLVSFGPAAKSSNLETDH
ncbi:MAG: family 14 glycosylhydrolase [Armatimonadota bacterium]